MDAARLIRQRSDDIGWDSEKIIRLFSPAPTDFQVRFVQRLPFMAHAFGMVGITLQGRVWLKKETGAMSAQAFLTLLRHEAEHVRQQRERPVLFYLLYVGQWIRGFLSIRPGPLVRERRQHKGRFHAAYRSISYEEEAYRAGEDFLAALSLR